MEPLRRQITVQAQNDFALLVKKDHCRRKLDFERSGESLFRKTIAVNTDDLTVAPHIDYDNIEMLHHQFSDIFLA